MKEFVKMVLASLTALVLLVMFMVVVLGGIAATGLSDKTEIEDGTWLVLDVYGDILPYNPPDDFMTELLRHLVMYSCRCESTVMTRPGHLTFSFFKSGASDMPCSSGPSGRVVPHSSISVGRTSMWAVNMPTSRPPVSLPPGQWMKKGTRWPPS